MRPRQGVGQCARRESAGRTCGRRRGRKGAREKAAQGSVSKAGPGRKWCSGEGGAENKMPEIVLGPKAERGRRRRGLAVPRGGSGRRVGGAYAARLTKDRRGVGGGAHAWP